ncbi:hypothetical protein GCM10010307_75630 [Streptomyces vastus]|uniref:Uncharacterized protein n=1 Tax=Streptomyces vastus TaxID=285451 RepID=A0ABP6E5P5_9ACTN
MCDTAVTGNRDEVPGQPAVVDESGEVCVQPSQGRWIEAHLGRLHLLSQLAHRPLLSEEGDAVPGKSIAYLRIREADDV